jgi:hypothetical protein
MRSSAYIILQRCKHVVTGLDILERFEIELIYILNNSHLEVFYFNIKLCNLLSVKNNYIKESTLNHYNHILASCLIFRESKCASNSGLFVSITYQHVQMQKPNCPGITWSLLNHMQRKSGN